MYNQHTDMHVLCGFFHGCLYVGSDEPIVYSDQIVDGDYWEFALTVFDTCRGVYLKDEDYWVTKKVAW